MVDEGGVDTGPSPIGAKASSLQDRLDADPRLNGNACVRIALPSHQTRLMEPMAPAAPPS